MNDKAEHLFCWVAVSMTIDAPKLHNKSRDHSEDCLIVAMRIANPLLCVLSMFCVGAANKPSGHFPEPLSECWQSQSDCFADSVTKQTLIILSVSVGIRTIMVHYGFVKRRNCRGRCSAMF